MPLIDRSVLVCTVFALLGCTQSQLIRACQHDSDCADSEVCFVDGCGDPGEGLAVEVTPSADGGTATQDFALGTLQATQDFSLNGPAALHGDLKRTTEAPTTIAYTSRVTFRVNGRSAVIPDVSRHFQSTLLSANGSYSVPVSSGIYTVVVEPDDPSVPPFVQQEVTLQPGQQLQLNVGFPGDSQLLKVSGTLLDGSAPVTSAVLEVQAFSLSARLPVSQSSPVSVTGDFGLFVDPAVHLDHGFYIQAAARDATAVVPKKLFSVPDQAVLPGALLLGDFGSPTPLTGVVVGPDGAPVQDATVYVEGTAAGGGSFSSTRVHSNVDGSFQLSTLPALASADLAVIAVPPPNAIAGTVRLPLSPATTLPVTVVCPSRLYVHGILFRPEGTPAASVPVSAEALAGIGTALPPGGNATSGSDGQYVLYLEPGRYRVDFDPTDLPRLSRFIALQDAPSGELTELTLSKGRRVTGTVSLLDDTGTHPGALALVRFFRVSVEEGQPSAVLLDETYADASGRYSVLLPTR